MITFYLVPRPFISDWAKIQENTIENILSFKGVRVIILGDDPSVERAAHKFNLNYYRIGTYNGAHLCNEALIVARTVCQDRFLARFSSDCLLPKEFQDVIYWLSDKRDMMLSCKRFDMTADSIYPDKVMGKFAVRDAVDLHIFDGDFTDMPPLRMGWGGDDGWLCQRGRERTRYIEIDMTIYHQDHSRNFLRLEGHPIYEINKFYVLKEGAGTLDDAKFILSGGVLREKNLPEQT